MPLRVGGELPTIARAIQAPFAELLAVREVAPRAERPATQLGPRAAGSVRPGIVVSNSIQNERLDSVVIVPLSTRSPELWPTACRGSRHEDVVRGDPGNPTGPDRHASGDAMVRIGAALALYLGDRGPLVPRLRPMLEDRDAAARPLPRLLALPRGELDRPLPGGGAHLGGDRPVRPAPRAPAPLHVLLGFALHLAQPRLARAGRGARPDPPRRGLRDDGEPPVAARPPRAVPALRALQVGVEDRELPRAVHRLEHVAQPLHQAPARQPRQRRAGAPHLRARRGAGKRDHDVP